MKTPLPLRLVAWLLWLSAWLLLLPPLNCIGQVPNFNFNNSLVSSGWNQPVGVNFNANGQRMFVWEKGGKLFTLKYDATSNSYIKQANPVIDLSQEVGDWRDFGMLGFTPDPNFDQNGLIYLMYVVDRHHLLNFGTSNYNPATNEYYNATISRITRYKTNLINNEIVADLSTRKVLFGESKSTGSVITHESHGCGTLLFGKDGTLIASIGDGASYASTDVGNSSETYSVQAVADGMIRANENVGSLRSQMLNSFSGKILRLDPNTGDGIPSNPYYDTANPRSAKSRVWALGLRNPFRITIRPNTGSTNPADANPGSLYIGDVGWNAYEDLNICTKGGQNFGWPIYEGLEFMLGYSSQAIPNKDEPNQLFGVNGCTQQYLTFQQLIIPPSDLPTVRANNPCNATIPLPGLQTRYIHARPALDYSHVDAITRSGGFDANHNTTILNVASAGSPITGEMFRGNASVGGAFYTGTKFPAEYQNKYYHGDYGAKWIRGIGVNAQDNVTSTAYFVENTVVVGIAESTVDQALYYIDIGRSEVHRIGYKDTGNQPPKAYLWADATTGSSPLIIQFTGNTSYDPEGGPLTLDWDFGDGSPHSAEVSPVHIFVASGTQSAFTVTLKVTDSGGLTDVKTIAISLNNTAPMVHITSPANNALYPLTGSTEYNLIADVADSEESNSTLKFEWQTILRHNNHQHAEPIDTKQTTSTIISPVGCDGNTYYYLITLKVTDSGGLSTMDSVKVFPDCGSTLNVTNLYSLPRENSVKVSWNPPVNTYDEVMVVAKANTAITTEHPTGDGTQYTANADFNGNGTPFDGGKVVYKGTGNAVTVINLAYPTRYYFKIFTRKGTSWNGGLSTDAVPLPAACTGTGTILREYWANVSGTSVSNIPLTTTPSVVAHVSKFEWQTNVADNYGTRWRGFICAPETGAYTFWIAGDDNSELYLSTDDTPTNKIKIASVNSWTNSREWTKLSSQKSAIIYLTKGKQYYVEALQKEGAGGDNLAVGWQIPSNANGAVEVIPGSALSPFKISTKQVPIITWAKPADMYVTAALSNTQLNATANVPGTFTYTPKSGTKLSVGNDQLLYAYFAPTDATLYDNILVYTTINVLPRPDVCSGKPNGSILREFWGNVAGTSVSNIPVTKKPTSTSYVSTFEGPTNAGDYYGTRYRGYITAPVSGDYTFYLATDDSGELWLSTNDQPNSKVKIANVNGYTTARQWTKYASQKSAKITLVAGQKYYVEALQKEGAGGDNLAVGWQLPFDPNGIIDIVPSCVLSPVVITATGARGEGEIVVEDIVPPLAMNVYPNPFSDELVIDFSIPATGQATLVLYDIMGKESLKLFDETLEAGKTERVQADTRHLVQGTYLLRLLSNGLMVTEKLVLLR